MHTVGEVIDVLEQFAPVQYQESYDNSGFQVGNGGSHVKGVLLALDVNEEIVDEAIILGANLIICHHPLIFGTLKSITGKSSAERAIIKAVKNDIVIYASHTNIDNNSRGVSFKMAEKLNLSDIKPLVSYPGQLIKLVTFIPEQHAEKVRTAIFAAGAGQIGNYNSCSFNTAGEGTFRAQEGTHPFVGKIDELHKEQEIRFETVFPKHLEKKIIQALLESHPYEEVAYDLYQLSNQNPLTGAGAIGFLENEEGEEEFFLKIKEIFGCMAIRHSGFLNKKVKKIALCGGSGYGFLKAAIAHRADVYLTADIKYHQFADAEGKIIIADIGHYESEQFILEVFYDLLSKNFSKFAVYFTKVNTNSINYF